VGHGSMPGGQGTHRGQRNGARLRLPAFSQSLRLAVARSTSRSATHRLCPRVNVTNCGVITTLTRNCPNARRNMDGSTPTAMWLCVLVFLSGVSASEFPERECCDALSPTASVSPYYDGTTADGFGKKPFLRSWFCCVLPNRVKSVR